MVKKSDKVPQFILQPSGRRGKSSQLSFSGGGPNTPPNTFVRSDCAAGMTDDDEEKNALSLSDIKMLTKSISEGNLSTIRGLPCGNSLMCSIQ